MLIQRRSELKIWKFEKSSADLHCKDLSYDVGMWALLFLPWFGGLLQILHCEPCSMWFKHCVCNFTSFCVVNSCIVNLVAGLAWHNFYDLTSLIVVGRKLGLMAYMVESYVVLIVRLGWWPIDSEFKNLWFIFTDSSACGLPSVLPVLYHVVSYPLFDPWAPRAIRG